MESKQQSEQRFALLIDAENVSAKYIKPILSELSKYGTVTYKRIYGDWTQSLHARWKDALLENSITPIQQFSYTSGKNSTDSAMIIDAMDILYTDSVEGFCLVSSDSDFTRLASRLRESGVTVIGMGERKTPKPFRTACDIFTTLEVIQAHHRKVERQSDSAAPSAEEVEQAVVDIITDNTNNGKSTGLGEVGSRLLKVYPDFDVRSFGTGPLSQLLEQFNRVTVIRDGNNINVELSETPAGERDTTEERDATAPATPKGTTRESGEGPRRRRPRSRKTLTVKGAEPTDGAAKAEEPKDATPDAAPAKTDEKPTPASEEASEKPAAAEEPKAATEETPKRTVRGRRGRPRKNATAEAKPADAPKAAAPAAAAEPKAVKAPKTEAKPAAKPAAKTDAAEPAKDAKDAEDAEPAKPAKDAKPEPAKPAKPAKDAKPAATDAVAPSASDAKAAPKRRGRKPRKTGTPADEASDPKSYIRELVKASGADGVDINALNRRLRSRFRGFKIRDLGYTRINAYIEAQRGMTVVTRGDDAFAVLKSALKGAK